MTISFVAYIFAGFLLRVNSLGDFNGATWMTQLIEDEFALGGHMCHGRYSLDAHANMLDVCEWLLGTAVQPAFPWHGALSATVLLLPAALTPTRSLPLVSLTLQVLALAEPSQSNGDMPGPNTMMNVGYSSATNTIWLVGGLQTNEVFRSFDVASQNFTGWGNLRLAATDAIGQSYAQLGAYLYYLDWVGWELYRFNLDTGTEDLSFATGPPDGIDHWCSCVIATSSSSGSGKLYMVGGYGGASYMSSVWVLDVDTSTWLPGPPLNLGRRNAGCAANGDETEVFLVGGVGNTWNAKDQTLDSVEVLDVRVEGLRWRMLNDTLTQGLEGTRVVRDERTHNLLVLGGANVYQGDGCVWVSTVHIIDATTYSITVAEGGLDIALGFTAAVAVKGQVYAFGGTYGPKAYPLSTWRRCLTTNTTMFYCANTTMFE